MAVDRLSAFRLNIPNTEDVLAAARPRTATTRGVSRGNQDVLANPVIPAVSNDNPEVLPVVDQGSQGDAVAQAPTGTYLSWLNQLSSLSSADNPDMKAMLQAADDSAIPRQTALQDIFDVTGISQAASTDPHLQDWMSMLLRNGGDLDVETLSNILDMMRTVADPEHKRKANTVAGQDKVLAQIQALSDKITDALGRLDAMQNRQDQGFANMQAQIDSLARQAVAWQRYNTKLQGFSQSVERAAASNGFSAVEIADTVTAMQNLEAPGEPVNYVSAAEWQAAVAGINGVHDITDAQAAIDAGQLADQILAREEGGNLTIDPAVRPDIVQAMADGNAAAAAQAADAPAAAAAPDATAAAAAPATTG